jgi:cell division inhibitor SepF
MAGIFRRAMVYLGLVDDDYDDYEPYEEPQGAVNQGAVRAYSQPEPAYEPAPQPTVRTLTREPQAAPPQPQPQPAQPALQEQPSGPVSVMPRASGVVRPIAPMQSAKVHVVAPARFPDAQEIGDLLRASQPVIVNLQGAERELARRMIDFCSGVTYALSGSMEKVADHVFLLTPSNVEVSAEEKRRLQERGLYDT